MADTSAAVRDFNSVGVIGLGYVGLPLAAEFARAGLRVLGVDTDEGKVRLLSRGESYIRRVDSEDLAELARKGLFEASGDHRRLREVDAVLICVPTPLDEKMEPDLTAVTSTARRLGEVVRPGQLVVLESTTYPGTTEEVLRPILEERSGLSAGRDFFLAYSPEREDPGNPEYTIGNVPKVVGALTEAGLEAASRLYGKVVPSVVRVSSPRAAEAVKMLENTYRAVNIALVNELKGIFELMGVDVWEAVEAAKTKPFGFQAFTPGPGMGGHCIPVDPFYLAWKAAQLGGEARFIELAGKVNVEMPRRVVAKLEGVLASRGAKLRGARVLLLGAAYKRDVDDDRGSPFYEIAGELLERGAEVSYHDPYIPRLKRTRRHDLNLKSVPLTAESLSGADAVVIVTDHTTFDPELIVRGAKLVVDTRNLTASVREGRERIVKA